MRALYVGQVETFVQAFWLQGSVYSRIPALVGALTQAMPTMTELEAALKNRNKKDQIKGYKVWWCALFICIS